MKPMQIENESQFQAWADSVVERAFDLDQVGSHQDIFPQWFLGLYKRNKNTLPKDWLDQVRANWLEDPRRTVKLPVTRDPIAKSSERGHQVRTIANTASNGAAGHQVKLPGNTAENGGAAEAGEDQSIPMSDVAGTLPKWYWERYYSVDETETESSKPSEPVSWGDIALDLVVIGLILGVVAWMI